MEDAIYIYGIKPDNSIAEDPDAAVDAYYYMYANDPERKNYYDYRQSVVNRVKGGLQAYTYRDNHVGAQCEVRRSPHGIEYLKTVPNSDPSDNISSLPKM